MNRSWKTYVLIALNFAAIARGETIATIADGRCGTWGDSLNFDEAKVRIDFAKSCEKNPRVLAQIKRNFEEGVHVANSPDKRAGYPTYGRYDDSSQNYANPEKYFAPPTAANKSCDGIPSGYEIAFFCAHGCYTGNQGILFLAGEENIAEARSKKLEKIQVLDEDSTMENIRLKEASVARYLTDVVPGKQEIIEFRMKSGGTLSVTKNHPLIDGEGKMRQASSFKIGESLVKSTGEKDPIEAMPEKEFFGKVYNVAIQSPNPKNHVVVAQGYLNGALYYQNEGVKELNRILLRSSVTKHLLK